MGIRRPATAGQVSAGCTRRTFVQGIALGGAVFGTGLWRTAFGARTATEFDLRIGERAVNLTGRRATAVVVNDSLPAPVLRWREGDTVTMRVTNTLDETTSIHWHGMLVPAAMDGVPGLSFPGIRPGETFVYRFPVRQSGTYWYHSHSGLQEQRGLYGAIVIEPREAEPFAVDREHVVVLSDWTDEDPFQVHANLKKQADYYNFRQRTVGDFFADIRREGLRATVADRWAWGTMRMNPTDLSDVSAATYTYLMNGVAPAGNWNGLYRPGERVRLRFINSAAMTLFDVRIPGLPMTVVAVDGQPVRPVTVDEFRLGNAETCDVIVEPGPEPAYTVFAQSADRTGFARGTLATIEGASAAVPTPDRRVLLGMADMGHGPAVPAADPHAAHARHASHAEHTGNAMPDGAGSAPVPVHPESEHNPGVDMRAEFASNRLDDPGIGLRNNGRRVLTYADLASIGPDPDGREPSRTIEIHLTGNMERYVWSFDGIKSSKAPPIRLTLGERLRIRLVNDSMMDHPIHLHGMWSDLEDEHGRFKVRKHTLVVQAGHQLAFRVSADAPGSWAFHCHLALHMDSGMFRTVMVSEDAGVHAGVSGGPGGHAAPDRHPAGVDHE